jgi:hypothetical protein
MDKRRICKKVNDRKVRGKTQQIFLILTHEIIDDILERKYDVMGTTGNVYTVTIATVPSCTCPDNKNRCNRCKHIYFVLTRIMIVEKTEEDLDEYTNRELKKMFSNIPDVVANLRASDEIKEKYEDLLTNKGRYREITGDDLCPICLGQMTENEELSFCKKSCGHPIHTLCFDLYNKKKVGEITCLFCQKPWDRKANDYVNLKLK